VYPKAFPVLNAQQLGVQDHKTLELTRSGLPASVFICDTPVVENERKSAVAVRSALKCRL
jgi:hypothetical protein